MVFARAGQGAPSPELARPLRAEGGSVLSAAEASPREEAAAGETAVPAAPKPIPATVPPAEAQPREEATPAEAPGGEEAEALPAEDVRDELPTEPPAEPFVPGAGESDAAPMPAVTPTTPELTVPRTIVALGLGEKRALQAGFSNGGDYPILYRSDRSRVVSVSKKGMLRARRIGTANITLTSDYGSLSVTVTVAQAPKQVQLKAAHKQLGIGESLSLTAKLTPRASASKLKFTSSDPSVLTVDEAGVVTAHAAGRAMVRVRTYNRRFAVLRLRVVAAPASVQLPESLALGLKEEYALSCALAPQGSGGGVRYWVEDAGIARIGKGGNKVTAVALGSTVLHAETYNGLEASCPLEVRNAPAGIAFPREQLKLSVRDKVPLPPVFAGEDAASGTVRYFSSNKKCVKVNARGVATAVRKGRALITATSYNGKTASLLVTVKGKPRSISFAEEEHSLFLGDSFVPEVTFRNGAEGSYTLTSSDPAVALVGEDGRSVRGAGVGSATLTATSYNGKTARMRVVVPALPTSLQLSSEALTLGVGDSVELRAVLPAGQGTQLEFRSNAPGTASVEAVDSGTVRVRGVARGETTILLRSRNGLEAQARVSVLDAPTALFLSPQYATRSLDEGPFRLQLRFARAGEGGSVTFESSDAQVAEVSGEGVVTVHRAGEAEISARSYNGASATCRLLVGERPVSMSFAQSAVQVALGDSVELPLRFGGGSESYTLVSDSACVQIIGSNLLRAEQAGSATVEAVSRSGLRARCTVQVVAPPANLALDESSAELLIGRTPTVQLHATVAGGVGSVYFASSDPSVASVDSASGLVTAHRSGTCTIAAVSCNGLRAECAVTVRALLEGVKIGIDPGSQKEADLRKERYSPGAKSATAYRSPAGGRGSATHTPQYETNLAVAGKLRDALTRLGAEVVLTHDTAEVNLSNRERAQMLNREGVDFILRLQCDTAKGDAYSRGVRVYIRKSCAYRSRQVNGSRQLLADERRLANALCENFGEATGSAGRGIVQTNELTLNNWSRVPCATVELGVMSNPGEDRKLQRGSYRNKMVRGLVRGICTYLGRAQPTQW